MYFPYVSRSFSQNQSSWAKSSTDSSTTVLYQSVDPLHNMDNIVFYQPRLASVSQPPRFRETATASHLPLEPISSLPAHQIATHVSTILQGAHSSHQNSRNDTQGKFTVSQNLPNCSADDGDYFSNIKELLSGTLQKTVPASVDLNGDNHDGFIDIDTVLSDIQQKSPTRDSDYNGMADMVDSGTRGGSPAGSSEDPIVLGDNESIREIEDECCDAFAEGNPKGDNSTSTKAANLPAPFDKHQASDNTVPELPDGHVENTRAPQLILPATSLHNLHYKNDRLRKRLRRGSPRDACRKRPHSAAPIIPIITDLEELESRIRIPDKEGELGLVDEDQDNDSYADRSDDEDYSDMSKAAGSSKGGPPRSRKRVKRAKDREPSDIETPSTLDVSRQATVATSSSGMQESEEIPICGYLTLKAMESKVVYCLTFSQQLLPQPSNLSLNPEALGVSSHKLATKVAVSEDDSKEWVVERIMGDRQKKLRGRGSRTRLEYQVKWQGYSNPTWEPATALEDSAALDAYLDSGKKN